MLGVVGVLHVSFCVDALCWHLVSSRVVVVVRHVTHVQVGRGFCAHIPWRNCLGRFEQQSLRHAAVVLMVSAAVVEGGKGARQFRVNELHRRNLPVGVRFVQNQALVRYWQRWRCAAAFLVGVNRCQDQAFLRFCGRISLARWPCCFLAHGVRGQCSSKRSNGGIFRASLRSRCV